MSHDLQRILNLSKKTGDTVIVFNPESDSHQVIMDFDSYEALMYHNEFESHTDLSSLSEGQLLEKINADIQAWRSIHADGGDDEFSMVSGTSVQKEDWHSAANVLGSMHPEFSFEDQNEELTPDFSDANDFAFDFEPQPIQPEESTSEASEPTEIPVSYDPLMQEPAPIPMVDSNADMVEDEFVEESLDDEEPIFFEEPIE